MKKILVSIATAIIVVGATICIGLFFILPGFDAIHFFLLLGGCIILIPGISWWSDFFMNNVDIEDHDF